MKRTLLNVLIIGSITLNGCASVQTNAHFHPKKSTKIRARVTFYCNATDSKWGSRIASSNQRAREGITVAAHPGFKFKTPVLIPGLKGVALKNEPFKVEDRGGAVTSLKASRRKEPVFDVYVYARTRKEGLRREKYLASINPDIMEIEVPEDSVPTRFQKYKVEPIERL